MCKNDCFFLCYRFNVNNYNFTGRSTCSIPGSGKKRYQMWWRHIGKNERKIPLFLELGRYQNFFETKYKIYFTETFFCHTGQVNVYDLFSFYLCLLFIYLTYWRFQRWPHNENCLYRCLDELISVIPDLSEAPS